MSDLFGNHIVGFSTRWLKYHLVGNVALVCFLRPSKQFASYVETGPTPPMRLYNSIIKNQCVKMRQNSKGTQNK